MQADSNDSIFFGGSIHERCVCCLADGTQHGSVFINILSKCLNLIIVPEFEMMPLCAACTSFLEEVQRFRDMVLATQRKLHHIVSMRERIAAVDVQAEVVSNATSPPTTRPEIKIKVEASEEEDTLDSHLWTENITADTLDRESDVKNENEGRSSRRKIKHEDVKMEYEGTQILKEKRKRCTKNGTRIRRKRKKSDSESDTPISQIKKKKTQLQVKKESKPTLSPSDLVQLRSIIRENKKVRSNIILLLKYSTIVPFLNNFKSPFKCFYCEKTYIPFKELREHTEKEHVDICENRVKKVLRKLPEYIVTADISRLKCKICENDFKCIENLIEHLIETHEKVFSETDKKPSHGFIGFDLSTDILKCHMCDKDFPYFKNLLVHMNEHGSFVCYICGKKFFSERKYRSHVSKHEKSEAVCKKCGKTFVSRSAMGHHNRKEHVKSKIKCLKCPETFHFEHYAKRLEHMEVVHGIKKPIFKCETCGKECRTSGILSTHINLTHKRNKEYRCDICSYATFNSSHFRNHMNTHTGVKNHECHFCKKRFLKMYSLTRHIMMHMNDKRFSCPLCDATFIQKANMKSHIRHRHKDFDLSKL